MGSHTYTDQISWVYNIQITALQVERLHRVHVVDINSSVDRIISMPYVESVVSQNDFVAYRLPLTASVETLV